MAKNGPDAKIGGRAQGVRGEKAVLNAKNLTAKRGASEREGLGEGVGADQLGNPIPTNYSVKPRSARKTSLVGAAAVEEPRSSSGPKAIPRPEISVAQIVLLILSQMGRATFDQLRAHPSTRLLGAMRSENSFYTALSRLKRRRMIARTTNHDYQLTSAWEYAALKAYVRK